MADIPALADYLASLRNRKWKPGELDCGVFMADWVLQVCGRDPIADVRGTYATERQFLRILRSEGGFERSCNDRLAAVGYHETTEPRAGDIMTVMAAYAVRRGRIQQRPTGAICVSDKLRSVITSDLGIVIAGPDALPTIKAWTRNG